MRAFNILLHRYQGMTAQKTELPGIKSAYTVFSIIEKIEELDGARLTDIAADLDLPKSTVHDYLLSLLEQEYLVKDGQEYHLGLKFLKRGTNAKDRHEQLIEAAKPALYELVEEAEETVWLEVEEYGYAVPLEIIQSERGITMGSRVGSRILMHASAGGKVMLAHMSEDRVEEILDKHGLSGFTDHTITSRETLYDELDEIREQGYGFNKMESHQGLNGVAAPIRINNSIQGAIAISGPKNRVQGEWFEEALPKLLLGATNELELRLSFE